MGGAGGPVMEAPEDFATVYDPIETLTYVAARTSRISLGTSVLDALFQSPVILARRLATLDRLSGGRLVVGVGQGGMAQEFDAAGVSMRRRGAGVEEHLAVERAGRLGLGLTMVIFDWDTVRASVETFRAAAGRAGHDADALPVMLQV